MSTSKNIVFRIIIPILCALSIGAFFLPCLTVTPNSLTSDSDDTQESALNVISQFNAMVTALNAEDPQMLTATVPVTDKDGQTETDPSSQLLREYMIYYQKLLNSTTDNSWSLIEMIDLKMSSPKTNIGLEQTPKSIVLSGKEVQNYANLEKTIVIKEFIAKENSKVKYLKDLEVLEAAEMVALVETGLENVTLELVFAIAAAVLLLATLVLSVLRPNKVTSIIAFCTSLLGAGAAVAFIIALSAGQTATMNSYQFIKDTLVGQTGNAAAAVAATAVTPVFTVGINILFFAVPVLAIIAFVLSGVNMIFQLKAPAEDMNGFALNSDNEFGGGFGQQLQEVYMNGLNNAGANYADSLQAMNADSLQAMNFVQPVVPKVPTLRCLKGSCEGLEVQLTPGAMIYIGRDSSVSNVIVDSSKISRKHCSVMYDPAQNKYAVVDLSSNGTFMENGEKLVKGFTNLLAPGTIIYLYNRDYVFKLGDM